MNRTEYMKALEEAIRFLPEETRAAALDFYGEMIDDRMEDGMDEASAVAAMETPADIAARLGAESAGDGADPSAPEARESSRGKGFSLHLGNDAAAFSDLADRVMKSVSQALDGAADQMSAAEEQCAQAEKAMEEASRKMEQAPAADGKRDGDYTEKVFTCPASQVRAVALHAQDMPIRVVPCEGDQLTLRYYTSEKAPYDLTFEGGVVTLRHSGQWNHRGGFRFDMLGGLFSIVWGQATPTIQLEMPPDVLLDLLAHTSNGSVKVGGFASLCQVDLKTSNSRIEMENAACKALEMKSSNGRLVLRQVSGRQGMQCVTSNSRIEAEQVRAGEDLILHTSNSRVLVRDAAARGAMDVKTSNGSIGVDNIQAARLTLKTSNGSISGVLPGRQADWAIDSGTSNGRNSLPKAQPGSRPLSVHTSNGSISVRFREEAAE